MGCFCHDTIATIIIAGAITRIHEHLLPERMQATQSMSTLGAVSTAS